MRGPFRRHHLDSSEVVSDLYRAMLRRWPDRAGLEKFAAELNSGESRVKDVAEGILFSPEAGWKLLSSGFLIRFPEMLWENRTLNPRPVQLCFMHVMKTAGTSLTAAFCQMLDPGFFLSEVVAADQLLVLPRVMLSNVTMASGHLSLEAVELFFPGAAVCTVVRDPVDRAMSHYAHLRRDKDVRRDRPDLTLEEFVSEPEWQPLHTNYHARHLIHRIDLHRAWFDYSPVERLNELGAASPRRLAAPVQGLFEATPMRLEGAALEAAAVERLQSLEFVGVTENLDELAARVAKSFDTDPPPIPRLQVGRRRPGARRPPPSLARQLREANAADYACYEYARGQVGIKTRPRP